MTRQDWSSEIAWQNGQFLPRADLGVSPSDAGFVLGATVTEQLRTFRGVLFQPDAHAQRLAASLATVGITAQQSMDDIITAATEVAQHNHALLTTARSPAVADIGLIIFVTPGELAAHHEGQGGAPSTTIHSFPLAVRLWAEAYTRGTSLRCVSIRQVPSNCWPIGAKIRSRMHYFLAEREAAAAEVGARPLLLHADGRISETSTANIAAVIDNVIVTPPNTDALAGTSLGYLQLLAKQVGLGWQTRSLNCEDLLIADEVVLTSTPWCLQPAVRLDGTPIGSGLPGPFYQQLLKAWSDAVGLDIAAQARGELD